MVWRDAGSKKRPFQDYGDGYELASARKRRGTYFDTMIRQIGVRPHSTAATQNLSTHAVLTPDGGEDILSFGA